MARRLVPGYDNADISRHAARKVHDLISDAVAARLQIVGPELKDLLSYSRKGLLPSRLLLIDGSALVGAQRIGKSVDLNLGQAVPHRALDDARSKLDLFIFSQAGWLAQLFDQGAFFRLGSG